MRGKVMISLVVLIALLRSSESVSRIDPLVDTKVGLIRGLRAGDGEYAMFMGIPYAYVNPANPFGESIPHPGFEGTFEAFDDSAICPQVIASSRVPIGNLDCLHLNVYVPNKASSKNILPVMVWIHGGGFERGSSGRDLYGPKYLVQHDVILVTFNYRLGPYGFMCLDTPEVPGNQGLKDQHLALKWVKDNIASFGGNVNEITIFGESAGGVSVDLQLYFSDDKLFSKAIMQSGSALCHWGIFDSNRSMPLKLAEHLGLKTDDLDEALSFLAVADPKLVIAASDELHLEFRPCVEKHFDGVQQFMGDHPLNLNLPRVKNIKILAGHNNHESLAWILTRDPVLQKTFIIDSLKKFLVFSDEDIAEAEKVVRHFYIGDEEVDDSSIFSVVDFDSDFTFNHPMARSVQKHLQNGAKTIYQYVFSYNGAINIGKHDMNITIGSAAHADELGYLFGPSAENEVPSSDDQLIIDRISTLWTNFAKYGNPIPEQTDLLPVNWPPIAKDELPYLNIDSELSLESRPFHARMAFWDFFYKLYYKAQRGYRDNE